MIDERSEAWQRWLRVRDSERASIMPGWRRSGDHAFPVKPDGEAPARLLPPELFKLTANEIDAFFLGRPQLDLPVRHEFAAGMFLRELFIPAGTLLTGRKHFFEHLCIVSQGQMTVWEDGQEPRVIEAPYTEKGRPNQQRIGYAHKDTTWTTIWSWSLEDGEMADPDKVLDQLAFVPPLPERLLVDGRFGVLQKMLAGEGA